MRTRLAALLRGLRSVGPRRRDAAGLTAAVAVWVAALVLVAAAGQAVVVQRVDRSTSAPTASTATTVPAPVATIPAGQLGPYLRGLLPDAPATAASPSTTAPPFDLGVSDPLTSAPPLASILPSLPVITLPPLPPGLAPLLAVVAPPVRQVCAEVGVAIVVTALVKDDLQSAGIPVTQALTYLAPVLAACALFPPGQPSVCSVDTALNEALIPEDLRILVGIPALAALGLDQVESVEQVLASTGLPVGSAASQSIAKALGCVKK